MNRREYIKNTALTLGLGVSGITLSEIFVSCTKEAKLTWKPVFLSLKHAEIIAEIAETILPKTKTPGAKELGVPQFIDKMVNDTMDSSSKEQFVNDLVNFNDNCQSKYGKSFVELDQSKREEYLLALDKESPRTGMSLWGINLEPDAPKPTFYKKVKSLTLFGFYTSESIGKNVFGFDPVPGDYIACMPLKGQNSWNE
ncbi:hypothetical protein EMA8858_04121 [Emticicia aquatica]|uniref:Gluconate 2-dehydrogenase subunit 3 family protein n=1 Tax=Emticicia aquatica TaxID=1681835 RepID=A0ABN8F3F3_9BACT|nr:gluconate 2-dehydrogenase subunit 3 family protein [Emticicia aquatica]CAH0997986.1 hypothetical protein EMA8858_04121 [Emticicia aquatica]